MSLKTLLPIAAIVIAALIQILVNLPSSNEGGSPYSASTCEFLFFGPHGDLRVACEHGKPPLPQ